MAHTANGGPDTASKTIQSTYVSMENISPIEDIHTGSSPRIKRTEDNKVVNYTILVSEPTKVSINDLNPVDDTLQGSKESHQISKKRFVGARWATNQGKPSAKEKSIMRKHEKAFKEVGYIAALPAVKVPKDYFGTLNGQPHLYKKDSWMTIDSSGRLRVLKKLYKEGYNFNGTDLLPVADVTHIVLIDENGDSKGVIDEDVLEKLHDAIILLSTGNTRWELFNFVSSTADVLTNPEQKKVWSSLRDDMIKYLRKGLTNRVVITAHIGGVPTMKQLRKKHIDFNMKFKPYSKILLDNSADLRESLGKSVVSNHFMTKLLEYCIVSAEEGKFQSQSWTLDPVNKTWVPEGTSEYVFPIGNGTPYKLYSDEHLALFEDYVNFIFGEIKYVGRPTGLPSAYAESGRWITKHTKTWYSRYLEINNPS